MAAKCDVCGRMSNKYRQLSSGDIVCDNKTCTNVYRLESYLLRLEENKERDEELNAVVYKQANEMSAWLSIYRQGSKSYKKRAERLINSFMK